jgi:hypothetical protein
LLEGNMRTHSFILAINLSKNLSIHLRGLVVLSDIIAFVSLFDARRNAARAESKCEKAS